MKKTNLTRKEKLEKILEKLTSRIESQEVGKHIKDALQKAEAFAFRYDVNTEPYIDRIKSAGYFR